MGSDWGVLGACLVLCWQRDIWVVYNVQQIPSTPTESPLHLVTVEVLVVAYHQFQIHFTNTHARGVTGGWVVDALHMFVGAVIEMDRILFHFMTQSNNLNLN